MPEPIVRIEHLPKMFLSKREKGRPRKTETHALEDVSFDIHDGEIFGLLGPNGAGKTTLIKCLTTRLLPSSGRTWVNGFDVLKQEDAIRASIGCMLMKRPACPAPRTPTERPRGPSERRSSSQSVLLRDKG